MAMTPCFEPGPRLYKPPESWALRSLLHPANKASAETSHSCLQSPCSTHLAPQYTSQFQDHQTSGTGQPAASMASRK